MGFIQKSRTFGRYFYFVTIALRIFALSLIASNETIYIISRGVSYSWIGYLGTIGALTVMIFEFPTGIFADRYGHSISIFFSLVLTSIGTLLVIIFYGPLLFSIITIISSIGSTLYSGAGDAWAFSNDETIENNISKFYANSYMISGVAKIVGGLLGGILGDLNPDIPFLFSGILLMLSAFLFLLIDKIVYKNKKSTGKKETKNQNSFNWLKQDICATISIVFHNRKLLYLTISGGFYIFFTIAPFTYWQPFFFEKTNSTATLGGIWAIFISMGILGNYFSKSKHMWKIKPVSIFRNTILLSGSALLASSLTDNILFVSIFFFSAYHFFLGILGPTRYMLINQEISNERRASILSFISLSESLGGGLASLLFGYLVGIFKIQTILSMAFIPLIISYAFAHLIRFPVKDH